jgi:hypothetical protein
MSLAAHENHSVIDRLTELIDELLDAQCDTVCLADELAADPRWSARLAADPRWSAHLDYLRGLQRIGQQTLAQSS